MGRMGNLTGLGIGIGERILTEVESRHLCGCVEDWAVGVVFSLRSWISVFVQCGLLMAGK